MPRSRVRIIVRRECRVRICAGTTSRHRRAPRTNGDRAPHGDHDKVRVFRLGSRPPLAQLAWSPPSPLPPNDHADWATLGRQGRPRRPGLTISRLFVSFVFQENTVEPIDSASVNEQGTHLNTELRARHLFVQLAWSPPSPLPPNDHADWATLGRPTSQKAGAHRIARCVPPQDTQKSDLRMSLDYRHRRRLESRRYNSAAHLMARRWAAKGGPEGRSRWTNHRSPIQEDILRARRPHHNCARPVVKVRTQL